MDGVAEQSRERPVGANAKLQRAIILQLLSEDGERLRSRAWLAEELRCDMQALGEALQRLREAGVVGLESDEVWASPAAVRIAALGLIGI